MRFYFLIIQVAIIFTCTNALLSNYPVFSDDTLFTSSITENSTQFPLKDEIKKALNIESTDCNLKVEWLFPSQEESEIPFEFKDVFVTLKSGFQLNCQAKRVYDLKLKSKCMPNAQEAVVKLRLFIKDVNQYKPFFSQDVYKTSYVKGEGHNYILKVFAYDQDCVNDHHVCDYKIITQDTPFRINSAGLIWPSLPPEDIFRSDNPATVIVKVYEACKSRFKVDTSKEFNIHYPFRNLKLHLCSFCKPVDIIARVGLEFDKPELIKCGETKCGKLLYILISVCCLVDSKILIRIRK
ncbi:hypothetical protein GJ496_010656 [Pomphorhynchus laevis]|nr:hypothetical protein GJ496_010656 [Pomphorhynchus laevis]